MSTRSHSWQDIQERIIGNIRDRTWAPGELIPAEADLARQFGCARTTVNRAMRELAATGVVDRKRKAGTRVVPQLARRVAADIPIVRLQVEEKGARYHFSLASVQVEQPDKRIHAALSLGRRKQALHIKTVHFADDEPFVYEDRWVNTATVPEIKKIDLTTVSANEWLVHNVPFTEGEYVVEARQASRSIAKILNTDPGSSVLVSTRSTWQQQESVTLVTSYHSCGYKIRFEI